MDDYDRYLAVDHVRKLRRRYLTRATRNLARSFLQAARYAGGKAALATFISVAVIGASLWIVPYVT